MDDQYTCTGQRVTTDHCVMTSHWTTHSDGETGRYECVRSSGRSVRLKRALATAAGSDGQPADIAGCVSAAAVQGDSGDVAALRGARLGASTPQYHASCRHRRRRCRSGTVHDSDTRRPLVDGLLPHQLTASAARRGGRRATWMTLFH